jgi:SseB protein N-terminal domain
VSASAGQPRFGGDDGAADPRVAAALAAFAAGEGSEHAALTALAGSRLLVPVVAAPQGGEMALPRLVGRDGRLAIPGFTCLDALNRWRTGARPVPVQAAAACRAAAAESGAVVIDIAGPVPLTIEGARLASLAHGRDIPLPQDDPEVSEAIAAAVAERAPSATYRLLAGGPAADLLVELAPPAGLSAAQAADLAAGVAAAAMARLGVRLRRGIAVTLR